MQVGDGYEISQIFSIQGVVSNDSCFRLFDMSRRRKSINCGQEQVVQ